jgi:hypothetical protein
MCHVQCDILSKGEASHRNARAILSNGGTVKENGTERCVYIILGPYLYS